MSKSLQSHPFAALFPELPSEELTHLVRDIKERGQLEPIILYQGRILDGRNRYRACQIAGVPPQIAEFDAKGTNRSPEEFVLSRNLRRRHLSIGQKAAIALDWSEQMELDPDAEKIKTPGRPKGALAEAAKYIGINEQRVFEARQIRNWNLNLYRAVRAGSRSLNSALAEVSQPRQNNEGDAKSSDLVVRQIDHDAPEVKHRAPMGHDKLARGNKVTTSQKGAIALKPPPSPAAIEKALARIKTILGKWFYAEVKARNLIQRSEEILLLAELTDSQMLEIAPLLKKGWTFAAASREIIERLTPAHEIRALHTRAIENGGKWYLSSVGNFGHVVVWGTEKEKTLAKLVETLAKPSALQGSPP